MAGMRILFFFILFVSQLSATVKLGVDVFFDEGRYASLQGKRIGIVTNQTGVNHEFVPILDLFLQKAPGVKVTCLFAPEHGIRGQVHASEKVENGSDKAGIPVYSLYGAVRRPTQAMLDNVDVLIYDIQDIGIRSYTYTTTLFYVMEEAAKRKIPVVIFDRPNPINGLTVDGPMMEEQWRSYIGYINVPYCHGMTVGELAHYFNEKYTIGCAVEVVKMQGWHRSMNYRETGLHWVPTSPQIPEADTPLFYASTGILGELGIVNIGVGYTLPFKVIGAPWIQAEKLAAELNAQKLPGVFFFPFYYRPFFGLYKEQECEGVKIVVTNHKLYRPLAVQYMILGLLKTLYPQEVKTRVAGANKSRKDMFCKAAGNATALNLLSNEKYIAWKLIHYQKEERDVFCLERKKFLLY